MSHLWGINWQRYHADQQDMPHIERMGYRAFTIYEWMWNNRDFCNELVSVARKDAIFLARDHPLSEQKDDQWRNDPAGKGRAHADDWAQKVREGRVYTPLERTYFLGINEPDSNHYQRQIDAYNEAFCRRMAEHGLRAAAYSFGVGHPSTVGLKPDTPPDWSWYAASAAAILEGHHLAAFHEYGAPDGYGWYFWCNRVAACPYPFDAIFDECGIDYGVVDSGNLKGWAEFLQPEEYLHWLDNFQLGMAERAHTRRVKILAYNIFSYDHGNGKNKDWHSFDIRPLRSMLETFAWSQVGQEKPPAPEPPVVVQPPAPPPAPAPVASSIIDPLVAMAILNVESGSAFGADGRLTIRFEAHIFRRYLNDDDWFVKFFQHDPVKPWMNQKWRTVEDGSWHLLHTGPQSAEWAAFKFAAARNRTAALMAISMGRPQIMGFNHVLIGYPTVEAMFDAFSDRESGEAAQVIGFFNYCLAVGLAQAMADRDWRAIALKYNGSGQVETYARLLEQAYAKLTEAT